MQPRLFDGGAMNLPAYLSWPGKSAAGPDLPEHPAVYHMLDVAAVAERLIAPFGFSRALAEALVLLTALHDLGKISAVFRGVLRDGRSQGWKHWQITEALLRHHDGLLGARLVGGWRQRRQLYAAAAGHHGRPPALSDHDLKRAHDACGGEAVADAGVAIDALAALWPQASLVELDKKAAVALSWWLPGLVTAADWIGSNAA
ncbi:MAG: CRISPR-associated endonuclease Cas3'', partial [Rhodobacteraceae bacterium]|nr:CRISPR-associated endonuclease Cas3'' [Paracoccaceae bacterium]